MNDDREEDETLRSVTLQNAQSIFLARRRAEEELSRAREEIVRQSELMQVTLASIGDAVVTCDVEGRVVFLNGVAEDLTGWRQEEAQGRALDEVLHLVNEESRQGVANPAERALREGRIVGLANHTVLVARDGSETPIEDSAAPIRDEGGTLHGVVLVFRSIAERRLAEEANERTRRELADFFENSPVGMHWTDRHGKIVRVNRSELEMLGYPRDELVGLNVADLHVDAGIAADIHRRLEAGETVRDREAQLRCRDGSVKDVLIDGSALRERGELVHTRCLVRDVTGARRAQEAQARLAAIVESSQDAIIGKSIDGTITSWNAAAEELFGHRAAEAIGRNILLVIPPERHHEEGMILDRLRRGERVEHYETVRLTKAGRRVDVSLSISPVRDAAGRVVGASKIVRDISSRKHAERRLTMQDGLSRILAEAQGLREAAPRLLEHVASHLGWRVGVLWCVDDDVLRCTAFHPAGSAELARFEEASRGRAFVRGAGLPGRVWQSGAPAWIADVTIEPGFDRASAAAEAGLHGAFAVPISVSEGVACTMELFCDAVLPPDDELLLTMAAVGSQIGQFVERTQAEASLRESEQRFRIMAATVPSIVWTASADGAVTYANDLWFRYTGLPQEGDPRGWPDMVLHPDDREAAMSAWRASLRDGTPYQFEARHRRHDGAYRWLLTRAEPQRDRRGEVVQWFGVTSDIDDQKRSEETTRFLADASAELAAITDQESTLRKVAALAVPRFADWTAVDVLQPDGSLRRLTVVHADPALGSVARELERVHHYTETRGVGRVVRTGEAEWASTLPDSLLASLAPSEEHARMLRSLGCSSYVCVPLKSRDRVLGALSFVMGRSGRTYDAAGVVAAEDLAHRAVIAIENARMVATLQEEDRRKDEFLAMLAHELRNPLAPIRNAVQILRAEERVPPQVQWGTAIIDRQLHHMTRLVDDLIDVSRITTGKFELRKEVADLAEIVSSAMEASRPLVEQRGLQLDVTFPSSPVVLDADPARLSQVLSNLLNNAAKYTEPGGHVRLAVEVHQGLVEIHVVDDGIGIAPEVLPRIFDMFMQGPRASDEPEGGLGIGLALVRRLVQMHGGSVEARSAGLGKGSEFIVRLPVADGAQAGTRPAAAGVERGMGSRRILVVDDNVDAAESLGMLLTMMGHEVRDAHDGLQALAVAAEFRPDVVLLDLGLPKLSGEEVARRIRAQEGGDAVLLVAFTGWGQAEDRRRSREAGFDHHVTKPVNLDDLKRVLEDPGPAGRRRRDDVP